MSHNDRRCDRQAIAKSSQNVARYSARDKDRDKGNGLTTNYPRGAFFIMASLSDARVPSRARRRHPSSTHHRDGMMTRYARTVVAS